MSLQMSFLSSLKYTSLQELESGLMPSNKQVGRKASLSGPVRAHANLSPAQAREKELTTTATSGGPCSGTSSSADLQRSLVSRLHQKMGWDGGILFRLTWKERVTPQLRLIYQLRASGNRTSGNDCTGWPTPKVQNKNQPSIHGDGGLGLQEAAQLAPWGTPTSQPSGGKWEDFVERKRKFQEQGIQMGDSLTDLNLQAQSSSGSTAETGSTDQLNPAFPRWLMGLPPTWCEAAILASRQKRRKKRER